MNELKQFRASYEAEGYYFPQAEAFVEDGWADNFSMALDAQPGLVTTPSSGIPAFLTSLIDPQILVIRQAANTASKIYKEARKGDWTTETALFPVLERGGQASAYGDFNNSGTTTANPNWETRQPFLFQTIAQWGDLELARMALGKINYAMELQRAGADVLGKLENLIYFKGVQGLQNYGIQNDPNLSAAIAPTPKANGGFQWLTNNVTPNASPNEIYADLQALINTLINQSDGNIDTDSEIVIGLSPSRLGAITAANSFAVNVPKLVKENYPNLRFQKAIQYGALTAQNTQGSAAGEMIQAIAPMVEAQETGWCAFNEKLRAHRLVPDMSSFKQKWTSGCFGAVLRQPFAVATGLGY